MQVSPPQGGFASDLGSELGSVEDAASYDLRKQLRACQAERDQALVERDQAVAAAT